MMVGTLAWPAAALSLQQGSDYGPQSSPDAAPAGFDPAHTLFAFELRTRWGQRVDGVFRRHQGALHTLPDGRMQVRILLATASVEVEGSERYTELARGERFFDSDRFPLIEFVSEPHLAELAHDGGRLRGRLTMHGVSRMETFTLAPATCSRPGLDCDVVASGVVSRDDYGLDGWRLVITDAVRFRMRVRLQEAGP